jgi:hypothetical protein
VEVDDEDHSDITQQLFSNNERLLQQDSTLDETNVTLESYRVLRGLSLGKCLPYYQKPNQTMFLIREDSFAWN